MELKTYDPAHMPTEVSEFAALFADKPKMLTDEVQALLVRAYGSEPILRPLIGAENDADAIEGSVKDNTDEIVTIIRKFAKESAGEYLLVEKSNRRQLRHAYGVVRRRVFARLAAKNTITNQAAH